MQIARDWRRLAALAILLLAFTLRFYQLDAQSFWNDEGNSARLSERSLAAIIEGTASDIHPPLYYLLLRGWRELVGDTEYGLRSFSAFGGVATVALTMAVAQHLAAPRRRSSRPNDLRIAAKDVSPLLAGLLTAVSPPLIYYSQETRMYALLALEAVLATYLVIRGPYSVIGIPKTDEGSRTTDRGPRFTDHAPYLLTITAGLYTHYFFPAVLAGHGIFLGWHLLRDLSRRKAMRHHPFVRWLATVIVAGLLYLPWLPIFLRQAGGRPAVRAPLQLFLADTLSWLAFGSTVTAESISWALYAVMLLVVLGIAAALRANGRSPASLLPALMLVTPVLFMFAAGTTQPEFYKFMLVSIPFLTITIGHSALLGRQQEQPISFRHPIGVATIRVLIPFFLLGSLLFGNFHSLGNLYFDPAFARADYRTMAARIVADNHPNAGVILNAPNQWEVFTYYFPDADRVYPLPRGQPERDRLEPALAEIAARHERLYAIFWGESQRDPERLVERWLDANSFKATEEWIGDVRFIIYAVPDAQPERMQTAVALPFGHSITLLGYTLARNTLQSGDIVQVTLFWETRVKLDQRYKVFLHLLDERGELVAQRDSEPGGGLALTTTWDPGIGVVDNHGILIPLDAPPGAYTLLVGLYDVADPAARLPTILDGKEIDALPLATVQIR